METDPTNCYITKSRVASPLFSKGSGHARLLHNLVMASITDELGDIAKPFKFSVFIIIIITVTPFKSVDI